MCLQRTADSSFLTVNIPEGRMLQRVLRVNEFFFVGSVAHNQWRHEVTKVQWCR
jgi:hypothetical protein